ncbi:MAG: 3-methyl-2-oxobutanoate hydroxymethyltransferase [Nitrososphaerota archaeon]
MAERVRKVSVQDLWEKKARGEKIVMVTAYDYPSARAAEEAGVDVILVGDSGAMVVLGYEDTRPVTMEEMLVLSRAVARGARRPLLVGDMPFMSFQAGVEEALRNAGRFIKEGGMDAVKIEGGAEQARVVRALTEAGIPVMGHIGFTPQSVPIWKGYRSQGKKAEDALRLLEDAVALEEAGAFCIVLEMVTAEAAEAITARLRIPTIGIGSGPGCDGQVLVLHDLIGYYDRFTPKFAKRYADVRGIVLQALRAYREEVLGGHFPGEEHLFRMEPGEREKFLARLAAWRRA